LTRDDVLVAFAVALTLAAKNPSWPSGTLVDEAGHDLLLHLIFSIRGDSSRYLWDGL